MSKELCLDCPACKASIVKSYGDAVKMRTKLIKWDQGGMYAVCKACGTDVSISVDLMKSIQSRFVYEVSDDAKR